MPHIGPGFRQGSDIVTPSTITAVTAGCERSVCCLSAKLLFTTLAGISNHYNKDGMLIAYNDNRRTTELVCRICWKAWKVTQQGDDIIDVESIEMKRDEG